MWPGSRLEREREGRANSLQESESECQAEQCEERVAHKKWRFPTQANREKIAGRGSRPQPGPDCLPAPCVCVCVCESERERAEREKNLKKMCRKNANRIHPVAAGTASRRHSATHTHTHTQSQLIHTHTQATHSHTHTQSHYDSVITNTSAAPAPAKSASS